MSDLDPEAVRKMLDAQFGAWKPPKQPQFRLLVRAEGAPAEPVSRFGGLPLAPEGTAWPTCKACAAPMQFVGQFLLEDAKSKDLTSGLLLVFMCPWVGREGCEPWDPKAGSNRALVVPLDGLVPLEPPPGTPRVCQLEDGDLEKGFRPFPLEVRDVRPSAPGSYEESLEDGWEDQYERAVKETGEDDVLAAFLQRPMWQQDDEPQKCPGCKKRMRFVVQFGDLSWPLEDDVNLGDAGTGYCFACPRCFGEARFLWQCG